MQNVKQITTIAILIAVTSSIATYAFTAQNDPFTLIEAENKKAIRECLSTIDYESTSNQILLATETCSKLEIKKITGGNKLNNEASASSASGVIGEASWNKTISLECEWGERTWKVEWIEYHYTATDESTTLQSIKNSHANKYWSEHIGYHYVIKTNWEITQTRDEKCVAWADKWSKNNYRFIQIAFIGDDKPTEKQTLSLLNLTKDIQKRYNLKIDAVSAHQEWWPKSKKESLEYWYWSKAEFIKMIRNKYYTSIYGKESEELTYMWKAWWDLDFIGTIYQESRMNNESIWDGGQSIWYCQIHRWYQPWWYDHYKSLTTMQERLNYCHELYTYSASLKWGVWSRFHWFDAREKHIKNITFK